MWKISSQSHDHVPISSLEGTVRKITIHSDTINDLIAHNVSKMNKSLGNQSEVIYATKLSK